MFVLLDDLRPSNSVLSQENLDRVRASSGPFVPVKITRVDNEWVLLEGHSRAYVAWERGLTGLEAIEVMHERREKRLKHISQLRILPSDEAGTQWTERLYMMDPRADL